MKNAYECTCVCVCPKRSASPPQLGAPPHDFRLFARAVCSPPNNSFFTKVSCYIRTGGPSLSFSFLMYLIFVVFFFLLLLLTPQFYHVFVLLYSFLTTWVATTLAATSEPKNGRSVDCMCVCVQMCATFHSICVSFCMVYVTCHLPFWRKEKSPSLNVSRYYALHAS